MEETRLSWIGIFARLGIVFSAFGVLWDLLKFNVNLISIIFGLIFIFLYYNLLQLKNWSRILLLILNGMVVILLIIIDIIALSLPFRMSLAVYREMCPTFPFLISILFLIFNIYFYGFIIYFTRPRVIQRFR